MKKSKIRRTRISKEVRLAVGRLYNTNPNYTGEGMRRALSIYPKRTWPEPSLRAVQKILAEIRAKGATPEFLREEAPWGLHKLDSYQIPAEALPVVIKAWAYQRYMGYEFTVRHAKWVTRLSGIYRDDMNRLLTIASSLAMEEKIAEVTGMPVTDVSVYIKMVEMFAYLNRLSLPNRPLLHLSIPAEQSFDELCQRIASGDKKFLLEQEDIERLAKFNQKKGKRSKEVQQ